MARFWIGISGPIAAGKTTLAKALVDRCVLPAKLVSFSSGLKLLVHTVSDNRDKPKDLLIQMVYLFLSTYTKKEGTIFLVELANHIVDTILDDDLNLRQLYQYIGTDVIRDRLDSSFWINYVQSVNGDNLVWITDDVRFDNEAASLNFHISIDVTADYDLYMRRLRVQNILKGDGFINHKSERALSVYPDMKVPINYNLVELCQQLNRRFSIFHPQMFYE